MGVKRRTDVCDRHTKVPVVAVLPWAVLLLGAGSLFGVFVGVAPVWTASLAVVALGCAAALPWGDR